MQITMRHHWLLVGACGWVLLILVFANKFINFNARATDDYGEKTEMQSWTQPGVKTIKSLPAQKSDRRAPKSSDLSSVGPSSMANPTDWNTVETRRLELLSAVCKNDSLRNLTHTSINKFVLDRIFVCDKHKILFCQTPKVGNTQWKKVLIVLNGEFSTVEEIPENLVHDHEKNGLPRLSSLTEKEITKRLATYFKFFIVRDPFERLISAFKDKFVKNPRFEPWYKHDIAPAIIRKYRKSHRDNDNNKATTGLRFEDFIRYLGDEPGRRRMDRQFGEHVIHWVTYAELCAPCDITYSVVGHHETLERDAPYILKAAGIERLVSYPTIPPGITRYNRTKVERYFSGISKRDVRRLYGRYQGDFSLFGYPSPDFLLN
ncbi:carbohydrate sulfotransferase 10-like [Salvelinus fontinalis]|uniref:carbohydrate sulfotransferase 10-like n=1 Tax=Salvelinus fontinalis TaxID=8038 RepID=UPI002485E65B|nr:carbohydrate sulfotransferase 10-like [Salvelinus fontinalis]XP_055771692.1 carbohydrate sulfotransferase 10-like [Salvelinus fontinalis]